MHPAIADKREELAQVCQQHKVARLEVFGSAARGTDFDPDTSDADFLVEFLPEAENTLRQYFQLVRALRDVLGRRVDLLEPDGITNRYLLEAINRSRELVYEA